MALTAETLHLLAAGYEVEQIVSCPRQPCTCSRDLASDRTYPRDCGLATDELRFAAREDER